MQEHFSLTKKVYKKLLKSGVTIKQLYKAATTFDYTKSGEPISKISLLLYIDANGDFMVKNQSTNQKIAQAVFDCLTNKEQFEVYSYLEGDEDDE